MNAHQHPMSIGMLQTGHEETVEVSEVIHPSRAVHHSACMQATAGAFHHSASGRWSVVAAAAAARDGHPPCARPGL